MSTHPIHSSREDEERESRARRMLRLFALLVGVTWGVAILTNLAVWHLAAQPRYQSNVQMTVGWARIMKPILADAYKPQIEVFGRSWARDAFDPETIGGLTAKRFFNHAVSGGTAYENRRFVQSQLAVNPDLQLAILNVNSFRQRLDEPVAHPGFDPSILNTDAEGRTQNGVSAARAFAITLSGASVGFDIKFADILYRQEVLGQSRFETLASYDRMDYSKRPKVPAARAHIIDGAARTTAASNGDENRLQPDFAIAVKALCDAHVDIAVYETPFSMSSDQCDATKSQGLETYDLIRSLQAHCASRISYYDFNYPNAITMEGVSRPTDKGIFYRSDGHPRPPTGQIMFAAIMGSAMPRQADGLKFDPDFGIDLMTLDRDAYRAWAADKGGRCMGKWRPDDRQRLLQSTDSDLGQ